jgi:hypothetical protein
MAPITKMRIHCFGGKEVLQADDVEPSLPDAGQVLDGRARGKRQSCRLQDPIRLDGMLGAYYRERGSKEEQSILGPV